MGKKQRERRIQGLCAYCGGKMDREGYLCSKCNDQSNEWKHNRVLELHNNSKCVNCSQNLDREGWFCKECAAKLNSHSKVRNAFRRANGLCIQCGSPSEGYYYCIRCRNLKNERYWVKKLGLKD